MIKFNTIKELITYAEKRKKKMSEVIIDYETETFNRSKKEIMTEMKNRLEIMKKNIKVRKLKSKSSVNVAGKDYAWLIEKARQKKKLISDTMLSKIAMRAIMVAELNASMHKIVASPTAGSCGILPSVLITVGEKTKSSDEKMAKALFTAAGIGMIISKKVPLSGAEAGCQAECGVAAAMASAAAGELTGIPPTLIGNSVALVLKNMLGLVCDPVAGLVEVPCIKRNAFAAIQALLAVDLSLSGIKSVIPVDEVISAMKEIGDLMSSKLKETGLAGLATTPTGCKFKCKL